MQLREAGRGEAGDGACALREREIRLQDLPEPHVRVHDQLHPQAETLARKVHDELGAGELHDSTGNINLKPFIGSNFGILLFDFEISFIYFRP